MSLKKQSFSLMKVNTEEYSFTNEFGKFKLVADTSWKMLIIIVEKEQLVSWPGSPMYFKNKKFNALSSDQGNCL